MGTIPGGLSWRRGLSCRTIPGGLSRQAERHRRAEKLSPSVCDLTLQASLTLSLSLKARFPQNVPASAQGTFLSLLSSPRKMEFHSLTYPCTWPRPTIIHPLQLFILRNSSPFPAIVFLFHHRTHGAGLCTLLTLGTVCWS